ncbi:MAG TPA: hypothetical protein ENK43_09100 [Planctomycetes bacterium]|nr:hypothetical protein [Planctomycetota bacterium]
MSSFENLLWEEKDGVLWVSIHRPRALNALSSATLKELEGAFRSFAEREDLGAAVVTGADTGKKPSFAAGADIAEMAEMTGLALRAYSRLGQRALDAIATCGKPVVAAINGFALGGGLELAMACHIRLAADSARLGQPEINLGIIPGFGGTQRLPRLVGQGVALELLLSGDNIDGTQAHRIGLVDRVVAADELVEKAHSLAARLASKSPVARRLILDAVLRGEDRPLADGLALESDLFGVVGATEDVREGLSAFLEKRKPTFKGR